MAKSIGRYAMRHLYDMPQESKKRLGYEIGRQRK